MHVRVMDRSDVERLARIMGPHSAASQALVRGKEYGGPVRFYQCRHRGSNHIVVEKVA